MAVVSRRGRWTAWTGSCTPGKVWLFRPLRWYFRLGGTKSMCDYVSFVVHQGLKSSSLLVVRIHDTFKANKAPKVNIQPSFTSCLPAET
jgi:hypothetical protein